MYAIRSYYDARRDVVASVPFANMDLNAVMVEKAKTEKATPAYPVITSYSIHYTKLYD